MEAEVGPSERMGDRPVVALGICDDNAEVENGLVSCLMTPVLLNPVLEGKTFPCAVAGNWLPHEPIILQSEET